MKLLIDKSFASHPNAEFWSLKNKEKPHEIGKGSPRKFWFDCNNCNHEFEKSLDNIVTKNSWCPYCTNYQICNNDNCIYCFNKSFASHSKALNWSNKNDLTARQVMKMSDKKVWFNCIDCNHSFKIQVKCMSKNGCPYCTKSGHKLCYNDNCSMCYEKSFSSYWRQWWWSNKNNENPRNIAKYSNKKYWFDCNICHHSFEAALSKISNNKWCPYCCVSSDKLCENNNCKYCFNKSFASHSRSQYWSKKNNISPRQITIGSGKKYWFDCNECSYTFEKHLKSISTHNSWCPKCVNKTEKQLYNWLLLKYINVKYLAKYDWCKNPETGYRLCYDFVVNNNIIIELDGKQHFEQVGNWRSPEEENKRDRYKIKCALENGYSIIHINQIDVWKNQNNWDLKLERTIKEIIELKIPSLNTINIDINYFID
jgi:very-short-patch-repair endonuclease